MSNAGLFSNQVNKDEANVAGVDRKAAKRAARTASEDTRQTNADKDTYESGQARSVTGVYSKPKGAETASYKAISSDGIQEGVQLSDAAKKLLDELRGKYQDMDISVAEWSSDEEQDYYASQTSKDFSVLINPQLLEKMAADESLRLEYEDIIGGASKQYVVMRDEFKEDAQKIRGFSVTLDKEGNITFSVKLLKEMSIVSMPERTDEQKQKDSIEERRKEQKKADKERLEKVIEKKQDEEKVEAGSLGELIQKIKEKLYPGQTQAPVQNTAQADTVMQ